MTLIIVAMMDEAKDIIKHLNLVKQTPFLVYQGHIMNKEVTLMISGIGKTNAASAATYGLTYFSDITLMITLGIAGGYKVMPHEVYIVNQVAYDDVDVTAFNYTFGQVPGFPKDYLSDRSMLDKLNKFKQERLYTKDSFSTKVRYDHPYLADMEGASIYQVGFRFSIPVIGIKVVSDLIGNEDQINVYKQSETDLSNLLELGLKHVMEVS